MIKLDLLIWTEEHPQPTTHLLSTLVFCATSAQGIPVATPLGWPAQHSYSSCGHGRSHLTSWLLQHPLEAASHLSFTVTQVPELRTRTAASTQCVHPAGLSDSQKADLTLSLSGWHPLATTLQTDGPIELPATTPRCPSCPAAASTKQSIPQALMHSSWEALLYICLLYSSPWCPSVPRGPHDVPHCWQST